MNVFPTTWMELEGIMLSEISQAEKDKCSLISYVGSKTETNTKVIGNRSRLEVGCGVWGVGEGSQKAHTSSYKSWDIIYCMATVVNSTVLHI